MRYGRYGLPHLLLRYGLGLTFLWIAIDMFREPAAWIGYLPDESLFGLTREALLVAVAIADGVLGVLLLLHVAVKIVAALVAVHLIGILVVHGVDAVVIRDVGLLGAALALVVWPAHYRRHKMRRWLPSFRLPWPLGRKLD